MTTLLLVDDNELDIERVERGLRSLEVAMPIVTARDGLEALDKLRDQQISERRTASRSTDTWLSPAPATTSCTRCRPFCRSASCATSQPDSTVLRGERDEQRC